MSKLSEYSKYITQYETAEEMAGALQDINALRMQAIERHVSKNRAFFDEIRELYRVVRSIGSKAVRVRLSKEKRMLVAVTSNRRFAGTLVRDTVDALIARLRADPDAACLIIGRIGWEYFEAAGYGRRGRYMPIAEDVPRRAEFLSILTMLARYDRVFVWYPRFVNPYRQEVVVEDITHSPDEEAPLAVSERDLPQPDYFLEPEMAAIIAFFDTQVRYLLLERVLLEADLAQSAARFATMEEARERAHELARRARAKRMREAASISNTMLLESLSSFALEERA